MKKLMTHKALLNLVWEGNPELPGIRWDIKVDFPFY